MSTPFRPYIEAAPLAPRVGHKGFTLVELLIVVAIIGILSTIGVPTFRRMIQKSKKSEAKVNLGGIYTAEQAFLSEYGAYGNNLARMGFQVDGAIAEMTYAVGFMTGTCMPVVNGTVLGLMPLPGGPIANAITAGYPAYYAVPAAAAGAVLPQSAYGPNASVVAGINPSPAGGNRLVASCFGAAAGMVGNVITTIPGTTESDNFQAVAAGVIAPGVSKTAPTALQTDIWTITQARVLTNVQDGIQ